MTRCPHWGIVALATAALTLGAAAGASPALAHEGNPNYRSEINPPPPALSARMLNYDDSIEVEVEPGHELLVYGYEGEPYLRYLPDGTVEVNRRAPAGYLNEDRYGEAGVPETADAEARPRWQEVAEHGRYAWHDHRVHYMSRSLPPAVTNESVETKVFDWRVPLELDGRRAALTGTLYWDPVEDGGISPAVAGGLGAAVLASLAFAVWRIRARRSSSGEAAETGVPEAW
ncbi:MAG TPA: hypothetical protein VHF58_07430 [Solirubrobacterales bacterium]|nr:hypothetical protein [Solirubrobacterales bacterium]